MMKMIFSKNIDAAKNIKLILGLILLFSATVQAQWQSQNSGTTAHFRAISVVDDEVVWIGGSKGTVLKTTNGGQTWEQKSVIGAEKLDFRGIAAIDANRAIALSAGLAEDGAARIYRTSDGGQNWQLVWQTDQKGVFMDGVHFWDKKHGIAFGDPIDNRLFLLTTSDGGKSWKQFKGNNLPLMLPNEAAFAASNSTMIVEGKKNVWIGTGGSNKARVFRSSNRGKTWQISTTPINAGAASGIFGLRFFDAQNGMAVGGDYKNEDAISRNVIETNDGGQTWQTKNIELGFREAVVKVKQKLIVVGPTGSNISADNGQTWQAMSHHIKGFHALGVGSKRCWAVGAKGIIAVCEFL
jgi:photosystem II stability/assembly factor-like uncharacterized protein